MNMHIVYASQCLRNRDFTRGEASWINRYGGRMADFEWDPTKEFVNIQERNLDFATASRIWDGSIVEKIDERRDYGETSIIAIGEFDGNVLVVVYTWRGSARRIISARKANSREKRRYEEEIARRGRA